MAIQLQKAYKFNHFLSVVTHSSRSLVSELVPCGTVSYNYGQCSVTQKLFIHQIQHTSNCTQYAHGQVVLNITSLSSLQHSCIKLYQFGLTQSQKLKSTLITSLITD